MMLQFSMLETDWTIESLMLSKKQKTPTVFPGEQFEGSLCGFKVKIPKRFIEFVLVFQNAMLS